MNKTSQDSYAISKEIITNFFEYLTSDPPKAIQYYAQDTTLTWINIKARNSENDIVTVVGRHSVHQFYKTIPEYVYEILSYDTQTVVAENAPNITVLIVSGNMYPVETNPTNPYRFHCSFHIQMNEADQRAAILYHIINVFEKGI